jgi:hypothetical protein
MSAEIFQFATAPKRAAKNMTSTRVGDIGDNLPAEVVLGRRGRPLPEPLTKTCKNQRLRDARKDAWNHARRTTNYWHARREWHDALSVAQSYGIGDSPSFPPVDSPERCSFVGKWREAPVKQFLTPAHGGRYCRCSDSAKRRNTGCACSRCISVGRNLEPVR